LGVSYQLRILIKSLARAVQSNPLLSLIILGDGPERSSLENLVRSEGLEKYISFKGYVTGTGKARYLAESDVVVVPSIIDSYGSEEGLPIVALEALSYGKILIATKTGGLEELVTSGNGILVEQNNVAELAEAIMRVSTKPGQALFYALPARQTAEAYSWEFITDSFFKLARSIKSHA
jgi:glycosyltransferase involved in cell wall biosynthesis